jgi:hypothetical protein
MLQGGDINVAPGYTSKAECQSAAPSRGGFATCQAYAPDGNTWALFFKHQYGVRYVFRIPNQGECEAYRNALKPEVPARCQPLDGHASGRLFRRADAHSIHTSAVMDL